MRVEGGRSPILTFLPEGEGIPRGPGPLDSWLRRNDEGGVGGGDAPSS